MFSCKNDSVINVRVEFGEGEGKVPKGCFETF